VDYHDLLADHYGRDAIEKSAYLSQQLHMICKDLDLAGLVIQSLNKRGYSDPTMENLSGSTKVMHTADQIVIMVKDKTNPNLVYLKWNKVRDGEATNDGIILTKLKGFPAFGNYQREEKSEGKDYVNVYRG